MAPPDRPITLAEVAKHTTADDCWIILHGMVYDVTRWIPRHPGGPVILKFAGADASDQFEAFHLPRVSTYLKAWQVGHVADAPPVDPITADYRELRTQLWKQGYFQVSWAYFVTKHLITLALALLAAYVSLTNMTNSYTQTFCAAFLLAMCWHQSAFLAHDSMHNGITRPRGDKQGQFNWFGWFHASVIFGISSAKWLDEHNVHHALTLRPRNDPQFNYLPMWLQSKKELVNHGGDFTPTRLMRFLVSIQHYTLLPLCMIFGRVNFYGESFVYAFRHRRWADVVGMCIYWTYFLALLMAQPVGWKFKLLYFLVSHVVVGTLHVQLLISHLATEVFSREEELALGFFHFQLRTSRNIDSYWYSHWFHGGLEMQIEHHLFPMLPRHNLRTIQPLVRNLCEKHNIEYMSTGFWHAIRLCLEDFRDTAHSLMFLEV